MARRPLRSEPRPAHGGARDPGAGAARRHRPERRADDLHRHPQLRPGRGRGRRHRPRPRRRAASRRARRRGQGRAGGGGPRHPRPPRPQRRRPRLRRAGRRRPSSPTATPPGARRPAMARLAAAGGIGGGEGIDHGFRPDREIAEGEALAGPGWTLTALATPGHTADHLSFAWAEGNALFSGDHVMGWATTLISPPDGDLAAFRASLARLQARPEAVFYPGHGAPIADPQAIMAHVLAHRAMREAEILAALARGPATAAEPGRGDLHRRRSGAARRGGAQRARAPHRPRRARPGGGGGAVRHRRLAAGRMSGRPPCATHGTGQAQARAPRHEGPHGSRAPHHLGSNTPPEAPARSAGSAPRGIPAANGGAK